MAQRELNYKDMVRITKGFNAGYECSVFAISDGRYLSGGPKTFWFKADECEILAPQSFWDWILGRPSVAL